MKLLWDAGARRCEGGRRRERGVRVGGGASEGWLSNVSIVGRLTCDPGGGGLVFGLFVPAWSGAERGRGVGWGRDPGAGAVNEPSYCQKSPNNTKNALRTPG